MPATGLKRIAIVCNPKAGKGRAIGIVEDLQRKLKELSIPFETYTEQWPANFDAFESVWLSGGDGTLNYFINQYPNLSIPVAIFKGGSGNDFAWKLYGNKTVEAYSEIALTAIPKKTDAGICNGKYFINGAGIGFDGEVVKAMGAKKFLSAGHLAYLITVLKKIFFYREKDLLIDTNDLQRKEKLFMISVANGSRYGGGFLVAPQAVVDDGWLDIVSIKKIAPLKRFFYLPKVEQGRHINLTFVEAFTTKKIIIRSAQILSAHVDGELMEADTFDIEILPGRFLFLF